MLEKFCEGETEAVIDSKGGIIECFGRKYSSCVPDLRDDRAVPSHLPVLQFVSRNSFRELLCEISVPRIDRLYEAT